MYDFNGWVQAALYDFELFAIQDIWQANQATTRSINIAGNILYRNIYTANSDSIESQVC